MAVKKHWELALVVGCCAILGAILVGPSRPTAIEPSPHADPAPITRTPPPMVIPPDEANESAQTEGWDKAVPQTGYEDVRRLRKNPLAGSREATMKGQALFNQNCAPCHGDTGLRWTGGPCFRPKAIEPDQQSDLQIWGRVTWPSSAAPNMACRAREWLLGTVV
jgi:hypothetical protein